MLRTLFCRFLLPFAALLPKRPMLIVLMYHRIGAGGKYAVDAAVLRAHIDDLRRRGFRFVHASQAARWTPESGSACALTFDDGYADNAALKDIGVPATVFVTTAPRPEETSVAAEEFGGESLVKDLRAHSIEIGAHGVTHRKWTGLAPDELTDELIKAKETLEHWSGAAVTTCAYPKGATNDTVVRATRAVYDAAFLADGAPLSHTPNDPWKIPRVGVFGDTSMPEFRLRTSALFCYLLPLWLRWKRSR